MQEELTPMNSGFRADEEITIKLTGKDFAMLVGSAEELFENNIRVVRPLRYRYYNKDGEYIPNPTKQQLENNELVKSFDPLGFMSANNLIEAFVGEISPAVIEARKVLFSIQEQGIDQGKAVPFSVLIAEQEVKNKSNLEVLNE